MLLDKSFMCDNCGSSNEPCVAPIVVGAGSDTIKHNDSFAVGKVIFDQVASSARESKICF